MKRSLTFSSAAALSLAALATAADADAQGGGFSGPDNLQQVTVAEALQLPDDTNVKLQGYIVRALGDEKYEFRDDSGTIVVEIDDDDWGGVDATPDIQVELTGEIDAERNGNELEAETVQRLN